MLLLTLFDTEPAWNESLVQGGILNALEGAHRRLADANALVDGGHFLPALFLETDSASATMAGDLGRGVVADDASVLVDHTRPDIDIVIGSLP